MSDLQIGDLVAIKTNYGEVDGTIRDILGNEFRINVAGGEWVAFRDQLRLLARPPASEMWVLEGGRDDGGSCVVGPFPNKEEADAFDLRVENLFQRLGKESPGFEPVRVVRPYEMLL